MSVAISPGEIEFILCKSLLRSCAKLFTAVITADLATERVREVSMNGANKFFIRRLKEDMKDWDGNALYKERHTKTVSYDLTSDEKRLYDAVTNYLTQQKKEASETKNIHVSLALQVMQRRLVSSIFAIRNTLLKRWLALQELVDESVPMETACQAG